MSLPKFLWLALLLLPGCASLLFPSVAPPVYYQLDYHPAPGHCQKAFEQALRVWKFTASSPYGRTEMVIVKPDGQVQFSSAFQWVASPGTLVADSLQRDLTLSSLFPRVVSANDPTNVPLELTGHIFVYAWERGNSTSCASLQVEVSLINAAAPRQVIFRREYVLKGRPLAQDTSAAFAQAMSGLVEEFSQKFQSDLCAALTACRTNSLSTKK
jgi:ABC-type uncharacterized transport system auxiliary subunit